MKKKYKSARLKATSESLNTVFNGFYISMSDNRKDPTDELTLFELIRLLKQKNIDVDRYSEIGRNLRKYIQSEGSEETTLIYYE